MQITSTVIGRLDNGRDLISYQLESKAGLRLQVLNLGAVMKALEVPVQAGEPVSVLLGYDHGRAYIHDQHYHGAILGRYANRIGGASYKVDGESVVLNANEGENQLHGGQGGFHKRLWEVHDGSAQSLTLAYSSPHGSEGYPGTVKCEVCYSLDDELSLQIDLRASTDRATVINLSSHGYFNLAGHGDVRNHRLRVMADAYTPVDADMVPTGDICSLDDSVLDLRQAVSLGAVLNSDDENLLRCGGLDHNYVLRGEGQRLVAELDCPDSGIGMQLFTTQPGLQVYTGNHLATGGFHGAHEGVCLEPQNFPDAPNNPHFPSALLRPGEVYRQQIVYSFSTC